NDVALDLVRAGVDRGLAEVAVARRQPGREFVEVAGAVERAERLRERPDRLHHQLGQRLLDLCALDLEYRYFGARDAAAAQLVEEAQVRDLERGELDLEPRDPVAKASILHERPAVLYLLRGELLELGDRKSVV